MGDDVIFGGETCNSEKGASYPGKGSALSGRKWNIWGRKLLFCGRKVAIWWRSMYLGEEISSFWSQEILGGENGQFWGGRWYLGATLPHGPEKKWHFGVAMSYFGKESGVSEENV